MTRTVLDDPPEVEIDEFVASVWNLIYNMIEAGDTGTEPNGARKWWAEEFLCVQRQLKERGFNLDPERLD